MFLKLPASSVEGKASPAVWGCVVLAPSGAGSETVHMWLRKEGQREVKEEKEGGVGALLITAQHLHSHSDALVPCPRQKADESGIEGRLEHVLFVHVVVTVAREDLQVEQSGKKYSKVTKHWSFALNITGPKARLEKYCVCVCVFTICLSGWIMAVCFQSSLFSRLERGEELLQTGHRSKYASFIPLFVQCLGKTRSASWPLF